MKNTYYKTIFFIGIFNQQTGKISDDNLTDFTPAGRFISRLKRKIIFYFVLSKVGHLLSGVSFISGKQHGSSML